MLIEVSQFEFFDFDLISAFPPKAPRINCLYFTFLSSIRMFLLTVSVWISVLIHSFGPIFIWETVDRAHKYTPSLSLPLKLANRLLFQIWLNRYKIRLIFNQLICLLGPILEINILGLVVKLDLTGLDHFHEPSKNDRPSVNFYYWIRIYVMALIL